MHSNHVAIIVTASTVTVKAYIQLQKNCSVLLQISRFSLGPVGREARRSKYNSHMIK